MPCGELDVIQIFIQNKLELIFHKPEEKVKRKDFS